MLPKQNKMQVVISRGLFLIITNSTNSIRETADCHIFRKQILEVILFCIFSIVNANLVLLKTIKYICKVLKSGKGNSRGGTYMMNKSTTIDCLLWSKSGMDKKVLKNVRFWRTKWLRGLSNQLLVLLEIFSNKKWNCVMNVKEKT